MLLAGGPKAPSSSPIPPVRPIQTQEANSCVDIGGLLECSIEHQDENRTFKIYEPNSVDRDAPLAVLLNFHGFGSNADEQLAYGDFRDLSEREGFLLVVPQGSLTPEGDTHWNSELSPESKSTADDQGFVEKILELLTTIYELTTPEFTPSECPTEAPSLYLACSLSESLKAWPL